MRRNQASTKKSLRLLFISIVILAVFLCVRLVVLMVFQSEHFGSQAKQVQQRERGIKAKRGNIYDRNGIALTTNRPVCTISVIHSQITDSKRVITELSKRLGLKEELVRKKVEKRSIRERILSNVDKELGEQIRELKLDGVMVDEDYKRYYPYGSLFSHVLGFTGADNQGILGLEVQYDGVLAGKPGTLFTYTNARGIELKDMPKERVNPVPGKDLYTSLDYNIQSYATQLAQKLMVEKQALGVHIIVMNPRDGGILAMVDVPEYDLNHPFSAKSSDGTQKTLGTEQLNRLWRSFCISDTYEPGSTFKIITATAALESGVVNETDQFYCPGYRKVSDRLIHCHKRTGHGAETFRVGIMNSCNPVFIDVGQRVGADRFYEYFKKLGLMEKTGIDLPGESNSILHNKDKVGEVELATISFGQSFQITPIQLIRAASIVINGGKWITPHFLTAVGTMSESEPISLQQQDTSQPEKEEKQVISSNTSSRMRALLEAVVSEGSGKNGAVSGYAIGGKTATSEKLPRRSGKYIASFLGFAPADNPQIITLLLIDEPKGTYYGGTIAAPAVKELYENILPGLKELP